MKKMDDFKDTFFLTDFEDEVKLRCSEFYYMPSDVAKILKDIRLGIAHPAVLKRYIANRYNITNWFILLEKEKFSDISEYAVCEIFIDRKECYAFDIEVAYHQ